MRKVFRIWKMLERDIEMSELFDKEVLKSDIEITISSLKTGWPQKFEGKTIEEIKEMGFECNESWLVEEE